MNHLRVVVIPLIWAIRKLEITLIMTGGMKTLGNHRLWVRKDH